MEGQKDRQDSSGVSMELSSEAPVEKVGVGETIVVNFKFICCPLDSLESVLEDCRN